MKLLEIPIINFGIYVLTLGGILVLIGFLISLIGNLVQWRHQRRQTNWKIKLANKEVLDALIEPVLGGAYPQREDIIQLINQKKDKYSLKKRQLLNVDKFVNYIVAEIFGQYKIDPEQRLKLSSSLREKTKTIVKEPRTFRDKLRSFMMIRKKIRYHYEEVKEDKEPLPKENKKEKPIRVESPPNTNLLESNLHFSDDFDKFEGWNDYNKGTVSQSVDFKYSGNFSLKKDLNGDPHGGFKKIGGHIGFEEIDEIKFKGYLYRPAVLSPNLGDRLAIEDANFCGYGFCVNHSLNTVWVERRDNGKPMIISQQINFIAPKDLWYKFEFHMNKDGKFRFYIFNINSDSLPALELNSFIDKKYHFFDRVAIHGGFPFYVDNLKIES